MGRQGIAGLIPPERCANELTVVLKAAFGAERFPVDVAFVAKEYSAQRFPADPITLIKGDRLDNFEGALVPAPSGRKGWGIIYNSAVTSPGRVNFTLAHELGHYLIHRIAYPEGFNCGEDDFVRWDSEYGQLEQQANSFAATLLMPFDDFRLQIPEKTTINLDMLSGCAERYQVSLMAAVLRWLDYTAKRAMLVVSRDGYVLWARSSKPALRTRAFIRSSGPPTPISPRSLAARGGSAQEGRNGVSHPKGVWSNEESFEIAVWSEQYSFTISIVLFPDSPPPYWGGDGETEEHVYERMARMPGT